MRILTAFAHPDDESYGPAGTLAQATRNGHIVSLLTLTHGESSSQGISKNLSATELAKRRSQELRCAVKILGIQHLQIHNFSDKHLQDIPQQKADKGVVEYGVGICVMADFGFQQQKGHQGNKNQKEQR